MSTLERELLAALAERPTDVRVRTDLGVLYHSEGRLDEALAEFERALEISPKDAMASYNLATVHYARGDCESAERVLRQALELTPGTARLHYGLACMLQALRRLDEAIPAYWASLERDRHAADTWYGLGTAYQAKGDNPRASDCYAATCELEPEHPAARHLLVALSGESVSRPPHGFVRDLFDHYAGHFDRHLVGMLSYRAPELVEEALQPHLRGRRDLAALDLGCGTGLFGERIAAHTGRLVGVDISSAMLEQARAKGVYDELYDADILGYLAECPSDSFDVVSAVDVFIYVGALEEIVRTSRRILRPGGLMAFTVEADAGGAYSLGQSGRYRHSWAYLEALRKAHGFEQQSLTRATLRTESEAPCHGLVVTWR